MATATFKPDSRNASDAGKWTAGEEWIAATIAQAQVALWRAELTRCLLKMGVAAMAIGVAWVAIDHWVWSPSGVVRLLALLALVSTGLWWIATRVVPLVRSRIRPEYAAQSLELDLPELRHQLSSYVSLRGDLAAQGVRGAVVRSIGARAAGQLKQHQIEVPSEANETFRWWIALAVMLAIVAGYALLSPKNTLQSAQRLLLPLASIDAPSRVAIIDVLPGDAEVLADRPLEISAIITGVTSKDEPVVAYGIGFSRRAPLVYVASTDRYVAEVAVPSSTTYQVLAGDASAGPFQLKTRDVPVASVRQVEINPPAYTGLAKRVSTGGAIAGEENSRVTITTTMNRPIVRARVDFNPPKATSTGESTVRIGPSAGGVDMQVAADGLSATAEITLRLPREKSAAITLEAYRVRVWDAEGHENPEPITYPVRIIRDLPPEVTVVQPRELAKEVPINAQQAIEIAALDPDYGLRRIEWVWQRGVDQPVTELLWSAEKGQRGNQVADYRFRPDQLGLRVGDRVKVFAAAMDNREDESGRYDPNRTVTQTIEWTIVEPRRLPPPTAPEDGMSEPDDRRSSDGDPGNDGNASDNQGADSKPSGTDPSGEGQTGEGQSGAEQNGEGKSGDGQPGGDQGEGSDSRDPQSSGNQPPARSDGQQSDGQRGEGQPGDDQAAGADSSPSGDSGVKPDDSPGASMPGESTGDRSSDGTSPSDTQPQAAGSDPGQPGDGASEPGRDGEDRGPESPQHDGDAFEKIRDYLNNKRNPSPPRPDANDPDTDSGSSPDSPPTATDPSGDAAGSDRAGDRDPASGSQRPGDRPPGSDANGSDPEDSKLPAEGSQDKAGQRTEGEPTDGQRNDGEPANGEPSNGEPSNGEPASGEPGVGDDQQPRQPGDRQPPRDAASGAPSESDSSKGDPSKGDPSKGDPSKGEPGEGEPSTAEPSAGDSANGKDGRDKRPGQQPAADATDRESSAGETPSDRAPDESRSAAERPAANAGQSAGGGAGDGAAAGPGGQAGDAALPPEAVDVDYARQATDLVLDYLDQNRDTPDPELLKRLNWTPEELSDFTERWKQLLRSQTDGGTGGAQDAKQVEETLRSLGIRPPQTGQIGQSKDRADTLRNLRDSGNRPAAPSIYRDAFEAFRRGVNR